MKKGFVYATGRSPDGTKQDVCVTIVFQGRVHFVHATVRGDGKIEHPRPCDRACMSAHIYKTTTSLSREQAAPLMMYVEKMR